MIKAITSRIESNYLLIVASGRIVSSEEYRLLLKRYCDEVLKSGLKKIIVDETNVDYAFSLLLQTDIVKFYSSGELPEEFSTWTFACVGPEDMSAYYEFWSDVAQRSGYDQHWFTSVKSAREFLSK